MKTIISKTDLDIRNLCGRCLGEMRESGYKLKSTHSNLKDTCAKCQTRRGFEYLVIKTTIYRPERP